jgi:hypothetical protein
MLKKQRRCVAFARYWSWQARAAVIKKLFRNVLMHHELTSRPVGEPHLGKVLCYFGPCTYYLRSDYSQNRRKRNLFSTDTRHCRTMQEITGHYRTLQDTAWHYRTLQDTAGHYWTLQDIPEHYRTLQNNAGYCRALQDIEGHCRTMQDTTNTEGH